MPINLERVREAFYGPRLAIPLDHRPTAEEVLAEHEHVAIESMLSLGLDPARAGLGEHGSLIGGPGKPLRVVGRPIHRLLRLPPLPLEWFDYPEARCHWTPRGSARDADRRQAELLKSLVQRHLAGFPVRPEPATLRAWIQSPETSSPNRPALYNIFENISMMECMQLLDQGRFSVYEVARAITFSEAGAPDLIQWLHQFAWDPRQR